MTLRTMRAAVNRNSDPPAPSELTDTPKRVSVSSTVALVGAEGLEALNGSPARM